MARQPPLHLLFENGSLSLSLSMYAVLLHPIVACWQFYITAPCLDTADAEITVSSVENPERYENSFKPGVDRNVLPRAGNRIFQIFPYSFVFVLFLFLQLYLFQHSFTVE